MSSIGSIDYRADVVSRPFDIERIYVQYKDRVFRYLKSRTGNQQVTEDLLSHVFIKIQEQFGSYNSEKASLSTWIYVIARNTLTDYLRHQSRISFDGQEEELENVKDEEMPVLDRMIREEQLGKLASLLETLPGREREILILRFYYDKTGRDVAAMMGLSHENVRYLQSKAIAKLRQFFQE